MKDNLFELLLNLFEKTLSQLKENYVSQQLQDTDQDKLVEIAPEEVTAEFIKSAHAQSIRVFTRDEQIKLSKASYQFLVRMSSLGIISSDLLEVVMNQLMFSGSRFVDLEETKWTIRNTLASSLGTEQLAFLDLVLYQREDGLPLN